MSSLPSGWVESRLADIAEVRLGRQRSPKRATGDRMRPYLRAANVTWKGIDLTDIKEMDFTAVESESYELRPGDLLLSEASGSPGEVGKPGQWRGEIEGCCFQNTLIRVRLPSDLAPDYFEYFFREQALSRRFADGSRGVGIHHLGAAALSNWLVPLAPVAEQRRIVAAIEEAFSKLDAGEAGLKVVRHRLHRMRHAVLAAAVSGQLVPQEQADAPAASGSALEAIRRERWQTWIGRRGSYTDPPEPESEAPATRLPASWRWVRWCEVGLSQNGRGFPSAEYQDVGVRLLRPGNLAPDGTVRWPPRNTRHLPVSYRLTHANLLVGPNELVMNLTAQSLKDDFLGRVSATGEADECLLNQRLARLTPTAMEPRFALVFFRSNLFRNFVSALNTGSLIQHMYTKQLDQCWVPLPPTGEQQRIVAEVDRQLSFIEAAERAVDAGMARSAALRRSILKAAFDGRLVPQDPSDEPASILLERIRSERTASPTPKRRRARATA